jgi:hypothetical protein
MDKLCCIFCGKKFTKKEAKNKLFFVLCYKCYYQSLAEKGYQIRKPLLPYYTIKNIIGRKK